MTRTVTLDEGNLRDARDPRADRTRWTDGNPRSVVRLAGHPIQPMLMHFPIVCFIGTLLTDIAYWRTADIMWSNFSAWLLTVGLIMGGLGLLAGLIDLIASPGVRSVRTAWLAWVVTAVVLVVALFNAFVHSRDAYTSVVPEGLILSAVGAVLTLIMAWLSGSMIYRYRYGVV